MTVEQRQAPLAILISTCVCIMYVLELFFDNSLNCFKRITDVVGFAYSSHQEKKWRLISAVKYGKVLYSDASVSP